MSASVRYCSMLGVICLIAALSLLQTACRSNEAGQTPKVHPRPVTFMTLKKANPEIRSLLAGSVLAWKKETIGFNVNGRVKFVAEPGTNVEGRVIDESNANVTQAGTLIARIEDRRYEIAVREARAGVQDMQAEHERSREEYQRQQRIFKAGAGSQQFLDNAKARFKAAEARLKEATESLRQARIDLSDTELYAPFNGQIASAHVIPGGYAERGQAVVGLQMMDPMKVEVAMSPEDESRIDFNDIARVYLEGHASPLLGWVWNKAPMADTATRTFTVTLLIRNRMIEVGLPEGDQGRDLMRTKGLWTLESRTADNRPPFWTNELTLNRDKEGSFVWRVKGLSVADMGRDFNPVFQVEKVRVKPGKETYRFMQIFTYRQLNDSGTLNPQADLLVEGLPEDLADGNKVVLVRERWLLRPGQTVKVDLQHGHLPVGFYVPIHAVIREGTGYHVFTVGSGENPEQQVKRVDVKIGKNFGTHVEIIPAGADDLKEAMKIVVDGANYIRDGDLINTIEEVKASL